jgi:hypothetical protein
VFPLRCADLCSLRLSGLRLTCFTCFISRALNAYCMYARHGLSLREQSTNESSIWSSTNKHCCETADHQCRTFLSSDYAKASDLQQSQTNIHVECPFVVVGTSFLVLLRACILSISVEREGGGRKILFDGGLDQRSESLFIGDRRCCIRFALCLGWKESLFVY